MQQEDINEILTKNGVTIMSAITATVAKVSHTIMNNRKLSFAKWCAIISISLFWAWMAGLFCAWKGFDTLLTSMIVGLSTLLGERINVYISENYKVIFEKILSIFTDKSK
jgi:hypothetical protein